VWPGPENNRQLVLRLLRRTAGYQPGGGTAGDLLPEELFLQERLQLAETEIRQLIDYLISSLPSFFKERLAVCYCES